MCRLRWGISVDRDPTRLRYCPTELLCSFPHCGNVHLRGFVSRDNDHTRDEKIRPALLLKSNPVVLNVVLDPLWANSAALAYANVYEKACRSEDVVEHRFLQCSDVARRITYLDTSDSLATEVKFFDGRNHGWDNGFWNAIQQSSFPEEALHLMTARMQESDFEVSTSVLEWLASSELRVEVPDAFQTGAPATDHTQAVEKLRKYVQLLGGSLAHKDSVVAL